MPQSFTVNGAPLELLDVGAGAGFAPCPRAADRGGHVRHWQLLPG